MQNMFKMIATIVFFDIFLQGCGSQAGNPSKPDDSTVVIPEIQYEVPSAITGESNALTLTATSADATSFSLAAADDTSSFSLQLDGPDNCGSILNCKARRSHRVVESVNRIIRRLSADDKVKGTGRFDRKGPNERMSGSISAVEGDDTFAYQATVCFDGQIFLHAMWSADENQIMVTRDFGADPLSYLSERTGKSKVSYQKFTDYAIVDILTEAQWEQPTDYQVGGSNLIEALQSKFYNDKSIDIRAVSDWYDTPTTSYDGQQYLVGQIKADATGEFASYIESPTLCPNGFQEDAANLWNPSFDGSPRWCFGRAIETPSLYSNAELTAALGRLEPVGVMPKSQLVNIEFEEGLACD